MLKYITFLALILAANFYSAGRIEVVYSVPLDKIPEGFRIENDGIYGISSFDLSDGNLYFRNFDSHNIYRVTNNYFEQVPVSEYSSPYLNSKMDEKGNEVFRLRNNTAPFENKSVGGEFLEYTKGGSIKYEAPDGSIFTFPNSDYIAPVGVTSTGHHLFISEEIKSDIPLSVSRRILVYDETGNSVNTFAVPTIKYFYTESEFVLTESDELLQLITTNEELSVIRYISFTLENNYDLSVLATNYLHFNDFVKTDEYLPPAPTKVLPVANRLYAVKLGEQHAELKYNCSEANLAYENVQAPDGDVVRTPGWLYEGVNAKIPYKWGGFQNVSTFLNGLASGKYAGDINTQGVSGYAVGNDCSGFVSRCWQLNEQYSTSMMPGITGQRDSWDDLVMGDAIHKVGHVRLYLNKNNNGALRVVEAAGRNWDVSYWSFAPSDLGSYTPRYYVQMSPTVNENFVKISSGKYVASNKVELLVTPQNPVLGYKVYYSEDGDTWYLHSDETMNSSDSLILEVEQTELYLRVAAVNDNGGSNVEGFWSNIVAVSFTQKTKKALIIDAFSRNYGSGNWQGYIHNFVKGYANSLIDKGLSLSTVSSSELQKPQFDITRYKYVYWILGDESTVDETFSDYDQEIVKDYLESGGNLFVSGSEIGWDLWEKGSNTDQDFYTNYLRANYEADDAGVNTVEGVSGTFLEDVAFHIGQTYTEDYPDQITPVAGGEQILLYSNGKGAGICYKGLFGFGTLESKVVYLGFPLESTANDEQFAIVMENAFNYFNDVVITGQNSEKDYTFKINQNYPNPFNPSTTFLIELDKTSKVSLNIYNINGELVREVLDKEMVAGQHKLQFDGSGISSGIYFANFVINNKLHVQKITLLK